MAFNPSAGYDLISSKGEVGDFLGSLSGANNRGQSAMGSAALRAKNYIDTAEKRAQLGAAGTPQRSSSGSNPWMGAISSVLGGAVKGFGQMGSFGGGMDDFSVDDAIGMGMDSTTANHIGSGGFAETVIDGSGIGPTTLGRW